MTSIDAGIVGKRLATAALITATQKTLSVTAGDYQLTHKGGEVYSLFVTFTQSSSHDQR